MSQSFRKGVMWLFVGNTGSHILTFVFGVILARLLAPEVFGILATVQIFTGLAGLFAGGGMGQALVRAAEAGKKDYDLVFSLQLLIGLAIFGIFYVAAPYFSLWYGNPIYADLLRVSALSFILRPFGSLPRSVLHREMRFKATAVVNLTSLIITGTLSILMARHGYEVWSLVIGGLLGSTGASLLAAVLAKWLPGFSLDLRRGKGLARYGLLAGLGDILDYLRGQASIFMISRFFDAHGVGVFGKARSLALLPQEFITQSVHSVTLRAIAVEHENVDRCRYIYRRGLQLVGVYGTPFYIGLFWLADPFIRGVYGERWVDSAGLLKIIVFAWPFWMSGNLSGAVLAARNWLDKEVRLKLATLVLTVLLVFLGTQFGIKGVAMALVVSIGINAVFMVRLALRCIDMKLGKLLGAFFPGIALNLILLLSFSLAEYILPASIRTMDISYVAVMTAVGALVYAGCFLYLPFRELKAEQQRWKSKLRLGRG